MENEVKIKEIIDKFYSIISGRAGEVRDWKGFESLFFENAHLMSMRFNNMKECISKFKDVRSYIEGLSDFLERKDFYEYGLNYKINVFGNIAHVYSEYEAKNSLEDKELIKRGVNLIQLVNYGDEWRILDMVWQDK